MSARSVNSSWLGPRAQPSGELDPECNLAAGVARNERSDRRSTDRVAVDDREKIGDLRRGENLRVVELNGIEPTTS